MSDKSGIEWTDATWNPVTGCAKVSQGCKNCYAEREWPRLSANPKAVKYYGRAFTDVACHQDVLDQPLRWTRPRRIFVNSMSDLFHEDVPFEFIGLVFAVMSVTTRHTYQVLTKRPARMLEFFQWADDKYRGWWDLPWPAGVQWKGYDNCGPAFPFENVWLGVSAEDQQTADERIPLLMQTPAAVRWVSAEPLIGPLDLFGGDPDPRLAGVVAGPGVSLEPYWNPGQGPNEPANPAIDWVVVGGESGPKARPMHPDWVRSLRDQCQAARVPFHFKQWGEWRPRLSGDDDMQPRIRLTDKGENGQDLAAVGGGDVWMQRAGKKKAGRELDGRTWDEWPQA